MRLHSASCSVLGVLLATTALGLPTSPMQGDLTNEKATAKKALGAAAMIGASFGAGALWTTQSVRRRPGGSTSANDMPGSVPFRPPQDGGQAKAMVQTWLPEADDMDQWTACMKWEMASQPDLPPRNHLLEDYFNNLLDPKVSKVIERLVPLCLQKVLGERAPRLESTPVAASSSHQLTAESAQESQSAHGPPHINGFSSKAFKVASMLSNAVTKASSSAVHPPPPVGMGMGMGVRMPNVGLSF